MARDHNVYVGVSGGDARGAFGTGRVYTNKTTLSRHSGGSEQSEAITQSNLNGIINIGLAFNASQKLNELTGAYTNNRLRQKKIDMGMTFSKYAIGFALNPAAGTVYAVSDLAYRGFQYNIKVQKANREANYFERLSGNITNSGSRYRGDYV